MKKMHFFIINGLLIVLIAVVLLGLKQQKADLEEQNTLAVNYIAKEQDRKEKKEEMAKQLENTIKKDMPGLVLWGDSLTAGLGGDGVTYPRVLQTLLHKNVHSDIPVINLGVVGEPASTIVGRAGGMPFVVGAFNIPEQSAKVPIQLRTANGSPAEALRLGDGGLNPVRIMDIEGIISIEQQSPTSGAYSYYFERIEPGDAVSVPNGTEVVSSASQAYKNYVPIVFIGENGGFGTNQELIEQIQSIVEKSTSHGKYLVLGLTTGTADSRIALESLMESSFGDRFVNLRELISTNGLKMANITPTSEDLIAMESGSIPPSLLYDDFHLNGKGYDVMGQLVFERMEKLGYFESVTALMEKIKASK